MELKSYFRSCGYLTDSVIKTESGNTLDLKSLPSFLRTLLVTDGTVTKSLEAWFWEPVNVIAKRNFLETLNKPVTGLTLRSGDKVLQREVNLCGEKTGRLFATANSVVSLQHLPEDIGSSLEKGLIGIGGLLRDKGLETYRDIFKLNYYPNMYPDMSSKSEVSGEVISRSYRIWVNGNPAIIVTEYFPISLYSDLNDTY